MNFSPAMQPRIRIYTTSGCADCRRAKWYLSERPVPFEGINIEGNPDAADFVARANQGRSRVPTFDAGGRVFHGSPFDPAKLWRELGL